MASNVKKMKTYRVPRSKLLLRPQNRTAPLRLVQRRLASDHRLSLRAAPATGLAPDLRDGVPVIHFCGCVCVCRTGVGDVVIEAVVMKSMWCGCGCGGCEVVVVGRREVGGGLSGPYRRWWNCDDAKRIAGWCGVRPVPRGEPK